MRKAFLWAVVFAFVTALPQFIDAADAKNVWRTFRLIKNGGLNTNLWQFNDPQINGISAVTMSIDGDRVKFENRPNTAGATTWLQLIKNPECVKGIKVEITMGTDADPTPLDGNFRVRIGNCAGAYGPQKDYTWNQLVLRNRLPADGGDRVYAGMALQDPQNNWEWMYDVIYSQLNYPEEVDGNTYLLTMTLDREKGRVTYSVQGYGKVVYAIPEDIIPGWETFWGIGTRSDDAAGSGTVWFGNEVEVLIDTDCPVDNTRPEVKRTVPGHEQENVDVGIDKIRIRFNEPMTYWQNTCEDGSCCPKILTRDLSGDWIEVGQLCEFYHNPLNTFIWSKPAKIANLNPGIEYKICVPPNYFFDLSGNGNKRYCFRMTTAP
jgi:hypothetical protein